jgi:acyl-CoA synthetase (AMP-forming)/AMP-acid ligase II
MRLCLSLGNLGAEIRKRPLTVKYFVSIGGSGDGGCAYEDLLKQGRDEEPQAEIDQDDVMMIMYTSGTTGPPKGVITSHRNVMANTNTMTLELRIVTESINLLVMPMYHNGGFWPLMTHFYQGATTIVLPRFDVEQVLALVEKEKVTFLNLVPTMLNRLVSHPRISDYNLESLQLIMYAAAPIAPEKLKKAMEVFGPHRFYTGLGSTEACGSMLSFPATEHALTLDGPLAQKLGTVGRESINVEVRIVDETGHDVAPGEVGEIIARGDNVSPGYWKMSDETVRTFREGWLYTGDMGYRDEDGYVFLVSRKKDMIISGGENVSPREIEEVILRHPYVEDVAVIGVPDEEWGEAVRAVVSLTPEGKSKVAEAEIIEFCQRRLSGFKKPKSVDFVDELPKNDLGKIDKKHLERPWSQKNPH